MMAATFCKVRPLDLDMLLSMREVKSVDVPLDRILFEIQEFWRLWICRPSIRIVRQIFFHHLCISHHLFNLLLLFLEVLLHLSRLVSRRLILLPRYFLMHLEVEGVQDIAQIEHLDEKILVLLKLVLPSLIPDDFGLLDEATDKTTAGHRAETDVLNTVEYVLVEVRQQLSDLAPFDC